MSWQEGVGDVGIWCGAEEMSIRRLSAQIADPVEARSVLTTNPDHNNIRRGPIPSDALMAAVPGERPYPTACAYFASRGSGVRAP
jgi:hypothetical protein